MKDSQEHYSVFKRHILPPGLIIVFAIIFVVVMGLLKPKPELKEPERIIPPVDVFRLNADPLRLEVLSQGSATAKTETQLVAEVSGIIEEVSPSFYAGEFFEAGDVLMRIDPVEYEAALASAKSRVAAARLNLLQAEELAQQAREDWDLMGGGEASELVLKQPQLIQARNELAASEAALKVAQRNLDKTVVRAPYRGVVKSRQVNLGQMVNARSSLLGSIFSVDTVEIRLPVSLSDTQHLNLLEGLQSGKEEADLPTVVLTASYGEMSYEWEGKIVRTEGTVDRATRQVYLVAEVRHPYRIDDSGRPPLQVGTFVEARIEGRAVDNAWLIPSKALMEGRQVYVINDDHRLEFRDVKLIKRRDGNLVIEGPLHAGEMLATTLLSYAVEGMEVSVSTELGLQGPAQDKEEE